MATEKSMWHRRLGHTCDANLKKIRTAVIGVEFAEGSDGNKCEICVKGKLTRASFEASDNRATSVLELVHSDVAFMPTRSFGGAKYFVTFIDDYSRKVFLYPMKNKNEVFNIFKNFLSFVENQHGCKIKTLRTDNGTEYCNKQFDAFTAKHGILHQRTVPHTPEQNGVAERMNRTILEKVRCMLFDSNLSDSFWAEAATTAAYLINRIPCRGMTDETPEERWTKRKPDLSMLKVFGCKAMAHIPKVQRSKLAPKAVECIFVGYSEQSKAYRLYDKKARKVIMSRDVTFIESSEDQVTQSKLNSNGSVFLPKAPTEDETHVSDVYESDSSGESESDSELNEACDDDLSEAGDEDIGVAIVDNQNSSNVCMNYADANDSVIIMPHQDETIVEISDTMEENESINNEFSEAGESENSSYTSVADTDFDVAASEICAVPCPVTTDQIESPRQTAKGRDALSLHAMLAAATEDVCEPKSYEEARQCGEKGEWEAAMKSEYAALVTNKTWELCELPAGRKAIDCKWVYKVKRDATGCIERYKARLVIKGYSQVKGIDYDETFSPVARYCSIRFLLAMAAKYKLIIHQMDAVTAFLQGDLREEIYMQQPEGFSDETGKVCRLKRALYGLKQASRVWNDKLNEVLVRVLKFKRSSIDQCIYYKHSNQNTIILAVWVDDIMIFSSNATMCTKLKNELSTQFKMKDLGEAKSLLGMNITRYADGSLSIDQRHYISTFLKRFNMEECNPVNTPLDPNQKLSEELSPKTDGEKREMANVPYQEAIGCIMYVAQISRPDVCFAVSALSRYNNNYGRAHWAAVKRVLRYLKGTIDFKLLFIPKQNDEVVGFCDADWASDLDKRRSTTGYVFLSQGAAISWTCRRQPTIALSSTEAEFMSMVAAIQEALWLKRFETEMFLEASKTILLYCDNQGAISLAKNKNYHARTKHIDVRKYFIQEHLYQDVEGEIKLNLQYKSTNEMVADILTKAVNSAKLNKFIPDFGLNCY